MNLMESKKRGNYIAALETKYINTTDMCLELFFWPVAEANNFHRPTISVLVVTEERVRSKLAGSTGYELEMWNRLFAELPNGSHQVRVEARRSESGLSGMSVDDVIVQPCIDFGKNVLKMFEKMTAFHIKL